MDYVGGDVDVAEGWRGCGSGALKLRPAGDDAWVCV